MATVNETRVKNLGLLCEKVVNGEVDFFDSKMLEQFDFEKAVTKFKKTKELAVRKSMIDSVNFELHFNVDKSKELLWDILFLGKYIDSKITEQDEKDEIAGRIQTVILEELKAFTSGTVVDDSINDLKESVVIFQKVRDALSHNQTGNVYSFNVVDKKVNINAVHDRNKLTCEIPLEYIDGMGLGIKPLPGDEAIAEEVDQIVSIITKHQGYSIADLPSLFYRVSPNHLSYLLSKCNNDLLFVENLNVSVLTCDLNNLKYFLDDLGLSIEKVNSFNTELLNCSLDRLNYLYRLYGDFDEINGLSSSILNCDVEILDYIFEKYSIEDVKRLSDKVFNCSVDRLNTLDLTYNFGIDKLNTLNAGMFQCSDESLKLLLERFSLEDLKKIESSHFFSIDVEKQKFLIDIIKNVDNISKLSVDVLDANLDYLYKVFDKVNKDENKFILLSNLIFGDGKNYSNSDYSKIDYFLQYDIDVLLNLSSKVYRGNLDTIMYLLGYVNNILDLNKLSGDCLLQTPERLEFLLAQNNYDINYLCRLNPYLFRAGNERLNQIFNSNDEFLIYGGACGLIELFEDDLFDDEKLNIILGNRDLFQFLLPISDEEEVKYRNTISFIYFDSDARNYLHNICNLSYEEIVKLLETNKNLSWMHEEDIRKALDFSNGDIEILKYVNNFMLSCDKQRFDYIFGKVNFDYKKLAEVPKELFRVSNDVFQEMFNEYEFNKIKTFMKTDNPKLIAITIYLNQFFSIYKNEIDDLTSSDLIDTTMFNITDMTVVLIDLSNSLNSNIQTNFSNRTLNAIKSIRVNKKTCDEYLGSIENMLKRMKNFERNIHRENRNIVTAIRNCGEHMQVFEDPNDVDSVILESSIIRNGVKDVTFRATVKYTDLIKFVQNLENDIKNADYSKSVQHKSELTDAILFKTKKEEYEEVRKLIANKYFALKYLNSSGIVDVSEIVIDDEIYYVYKNGDEEQTTKVDELVELYKMIVMDETAEATLQERLTPRIFK